MVSGEALKSADADFLVLRANGTIIGCGAIVPIATYGEVKRVFVAPEARGRGGAELLMMKLIDRARTRGLSSLRLEVGIRQPEAISLYRKVGFVEIAPFGEYLPDPLSLFMELPLVH